MSGETRTLAIRRIAAATSLALLALCLVHSIKAFNVFVILVFVNLGITSASFVPSTHVCYARRIALTGIAIYDIVQLSFMDNTVAFILMIVMALLVQIL